MKKIDRWIDTKISNPVKSSIYCYNINHIQKRCHEFKHDFILIMKVADLIELMKHNLQ